MVAPLLVLAEYPGALHVWVSTRRIKRVMEAGMDAQHPSYGTGAATVLAPDLGSRLQELVAAWRGAERGQPLDDLHRECSSAAGPGGRAILPGYLLLVEGLTAYKV